MYIRFDRQRVTVRLSQEEIITLQSQGQISQPMPVDWLKPNYLAARVDSAVAQPILRQQDAAVTLCMPTDLVATLASAKPSKEGYTVTQTDAKGRSFSLCIEIDIRKTPV